MHDAFVSPQVYTKWGGGSGGPRPSCCAGPTVLGLSVQTSEALTVRRFSAFSRFVVKARARVIASGRHSGALRLRRASGGVETILWAETILRAETIPF